MVARGILEFNMKFRRYGMLEKKVKMMPLGDVSIQDDFWKEYMELVRNHVIPYQWEALNDRKQEKKQEQN